jgi:mRNA interferase MazF
LDAAALPKESWVKVSQIRTLSVDRLGKKLTALPAEDLAHFVDGLLELIS